MFNKGINKTDLGLYLGKTDKGEEITILKQVMEKRFNNGVSVRIGTQRMLLSENILYNTNNKNGKD